MFLTSIDYMTEYLDKIIKGFPAYKKQGVLFFCHIVGAVEAHLSPSSPERGLDGGSNRGNEGDGSRK